jgi:hypothetical protein
MQRSALLYYCELLIDSAIQEPGMQDCKLMKVLIKGNPAFICLSFCAEILMHSSGSTEL